MDRRLLRAATFGGLLHDIGKFADRAGAVPLPDKDEVRQEYRYAHGWQTEEVLRGLFAADRVESRLPGQPPEATLLNLAARHHAGRHPLEWMVQEADRLASGHERAAADADSEQAIEGRSRKRKVRLLSILGRIRTESDAPTAPEDRYYRLTLPEAAVDAQFPVRDQDYPADAMEADYPAHWQKFVAEIKALDAEADPLDLLDTLLALCRRYQWCLPASARREEIPDVSLFEHGKGAAALAACLCAFHGGDPKVSQRAVEDRRSDKYLLFCGDVSGIQKFIYRLSAKGAYKNLKGRSFFIQLLSELLARHYIEACGLTAANILYSNGGKFYLLLPNLTEVQELLRRFDGEINAGLFRDYGGDMFVRTAWVPLSGEDLTRQEGRTLSVIWDELTRSLVQRDRRRFAALAEEDYDAPFGVPQNIPEKSCPVCHRGLQKEGDCATCRDMENLGGALRSAHYIVASRHKQALTDRYTLSALGFYIWVLSERPQRVSADALVWALEDGSELADLTRCGAGSAVVNAMPLTVGGNRSFDRDFEQIAKLSQGVQRLGVLRMDVDNLGAVFSRGLKHYRHENNKKDQRFHSLARITTLSALLAAFFARLLPRFLDDCDDWRERVTVVYSGGDDLFLLGAWDALPKVAQHIRHRFAEYGCFNPAFSLSGGMVITGGRFPIYKSAEMAGQAEQQAKKLETTFTAGSDQGKKKKNAFTFLDEAMHWREFEAVAALVESLSGVMATPHGRPLLARLRAIAASWHDSRVRLERQDGSLEMDQVRRRLAAERWRWQAVYALHRLVKGRPKLCEAVERVQEFICKPVADTPRAGIELLGVASRWLELLHRESSHAKEA